MKSFFEWIVTMGLITNGVGSILFIVIWIDRDFNYAYDQFAKLVRQAL